MKDYTPARLYRPGRGVLVWGELYLTDTSIPKYHCILSNSSEQIVDEDAGEAHPLAYNQPRLTVRYLVETGIKRFLSIEKGWVRTVKDLFVRPAAMLKQYIRGDRAGYVHPLSYLVLNGIIVYFMVQFWGVDKLIAKDTVTFGVEFTPAQVRNQLESSASVFQNLNLVYIGVILPFACFLYLFFKKARYNLAEMIVVAAYTVCHTALFGLFTMPIYSIFELNSLVYTGVGMLISLTYFCYVGILFFGGGFGTMVKTCSAYLMAYVVFILVMGIVGGITQVIKGSGYDRTEEWHAINAIELEKLDKLDELLAEGADPNMTFMQTPLHYATERGDTAAVKILISHNANLDAQDFRQLTPLMIAVQDDHWEIATYLKDAGASPHFPAKDGNTVLLESIRENRQAFIDWALGDSVAINTMQKRKIHGSPLILAASRGDIELVKRLLEAGADPSLENFLGQTAKDRAEDPAVIELLSEIVAQEP